MLDIRLYNKALCSLLYSLLCALLVIRIIARSMMDLWHIWITIVDFLMMSWFLIKDRMIIMMPSQIQLYS